MCRVYTLLDETRVFGRSVSGDLAVNIGANNVMHPSGPGDVAMPHYCKLCAAMLQCCCYFRCCSCVNAAMLRQALLSIHDHPKPPPQAAYAKATAICALSLKQQAYKGCAPNRGWHRAWKGCVPTFKVQTSSLQRLHFALTIVCLDQFAPGNYRRRHMLS